MQNTLPHTPRMALLIDGDNISARYLPIILDEIPKHGIATYRRIYGDFTDPQSASWRDQLLDNSIMPIQQFSNVKHKKHGEQAGKNATDSTLIIDAMDILYGGKVDGFIIVSSDSDFTRLAQRLKESNMLVVGMGCSQTSMSFRNACTSFVDIERLYRFAEKEKGAVAGGASMADADAGDLADDMTADLRRIEDVVAGIVRNNDGKGEVTMLAQVGAGLRNKFPDFDVRTFGYTQLSKLIGDMKRFELTKRGDECTVSIASTTSLRDDVERFVRDRLAQNKSGSMHLSNLAQQVYDAFPDFRDGLKDLGYAQFSQFADSIEGVKVHGQKRQQVKLAK